MARKLSLKIAHLYPDLMDTYGDRGNILTLIMRCQWRQIEVTVTSVSIGDPLKSDDFDIYFFGGGQDRSQELVCKDLKEKAQTLKVAVESGACILSICGGYQLLQNYFKTQAGEVIEGVGLFDAHTVGSQDRMMQNILIDLDPEIVKEVNSLNIDLQTTNLVGFENHSGKTFLGPKTKPIGKVITGSGNNGEDGTEGAVYKNAFGCYIHGSLLPKNPQFADFLIKKALQRKFGEVALKKLDDSFEWQAHLQAINIARTKS